MSLRVFLGVLLLSIFVLTIIFIGVTLVFMREQLGPLLTPAASDSGTFHWVILANAGIGILFTIALLGALFWVIQHYMVKPLLRLIEAMDTYTKTGERISLEENEGTPQEIKTLHASFTGFIDRVEDSHKHDTEISRVKSDFISTAAHQLRTPLTGIRWALEALQKEQLTENQKALVSSAVDKSKDLVGIVGTLLDISSIESGKYKYKFESTDVGELLSEITRDFSELAVTRQVSLFYAQSETPVPPVKADRERIKWVLNNLVENAIKYTPASGTVRLSAELNSGRVFIKVKDTGIGIQPGDRANIFERFYRAGNAITKENQGNGLGLYIARTIATDHGGDLNFVPNQDGPGTTFILSIPVA